MGNFIERQAAIEAIEGVDWYHQNKNKDMVSGANSSEHQAWYKADDIYKTLEALQSAEAIPIDWLKKRFMDRNDPKWCYDWHVIADCLIKYWEEEDEAGRC